jgi:predicted DNA-binding transcriptional regulator AlpA
MADRFVKDTDAASLFGISRSGWWRGVKEKQFPQPIKIGGATRWLESELYAHMQHIVVEQRGGLE